MITKLVIDRKKWGREALLNSEGTMCCLGFLCKAAGLHDDMLWGIPFPESGWSDEIPLPFRENDEGDVQSVALTAAKINDDDRIPLDEKEAKLIQLFGENGIELSFI